MHRYATCALFGKSDIYGRPRRSEHVLETFHCDGVAVKRERLDDHSSCRDDNSSFCALQTQTAIHDTNSIVTTNSYLRHHPVPRQGTRPFPSWSPCGLFYVCKISSRASRGLYRRNIHNPGTKRPRLFKDRTATAALRLKTFPGMLKTLSVNAVMVVMRFEGSADAGSCLTNARSPGEMLAAACERAERLVRLARLPNLTGLMVARSCRQAKVGTESWTTGSLKRKLGTTPLSTVRMLPVTAPRPLPPGTAMFFAMEPTRKARSAGTPGDD